MSIEPKELRPEQTSEIKARSEWIVRSYGVAYQKQAESDVRALLGHIAALNEWQPIETAPKSTKPIWLACDCAMRIGYWSEERWRDFFGESPRHDVLFTPTHWMPLPGLPAGG
jgi:hypothetical protein